MDYAKQIYIIREAAMELLEISKLPQYEEKRQKWADHNELKENTEPLIWICPDDDGGWLELIPRDQLKTEDPELRELEFKIRQLIYHYNNFDDDFVIEPVIRFNMSGEYTGYLYGDSKQTSAWGITIHGKGISNQAYHLDNYLDNPCNVEKLQNHEVDFIPDIKELNRLKQKYEDALDNIIEVQFNIPYSVLVQSILIELVHLRGLTELMYDLYDNSDMINRIMDHMSSSKARLLDRLELNKLLFDNHTNIYTGSGGLGYTNRKLNKDNIKISDLWGFADAQEFSNVSPKMFEEYALCYQKRGLNKFGYACYGCCEPLDDKFDLIFREIPKIRRLSVSPWSNTHIASEKIGRKAIYSWKPNPSIICTGFNNDEISMMLKDTAQTTKNCTTEIILKDIRTCANTPKHIQEFLEMAKHYFK